MLGSELLFHFMNVMLMTGLVAPLVLWRYRRAVLAGMQTKVGAAIALAPALGPRPRAAPASLPGVDAKLAWEARMRRRVFVAVVAALLPPALLLAVHYVVVNGLPLAPGPRFAPTGKWSVALRLWLKRALSWKQRLDG